MSLKTLQNFYKAVITTGLGTGTGSCYVSELPTPTVGYLVINPSNTTKREIVAYNGTGTDEGGSYVTLVTRGVGETTEQAHDVNEPVRLNLTAEYYAEVQDEVDDLQGQIDTLVLQNAPNASTTTRGIVLLSTAPAESGTAIVVATTDPKYAKIDDIPDAFVNASAGAADEGKGVKLNASGVLDNSFIQQQVKTRVYELADSPATWSKPTGLLRLYVQMWAGGGSGGHSTGEYYGAGGGGGGGFAEAWFPVASLGSTETITIGDGGAAKTSAGAGTAGGNTTFGSLLTAYGGGAGMGGAGASDAHGGGGGGGRTAAGANASSATGAAGGASLGEAGAASGASKIIAGGGGGDGATYGASNNGGASHFSGGGGGGGSDNGYGGVGGSTTYAGGGGGGASNIAATPDTAGKSIMGGNGGLGRTNNRAATAGSVPGGGGGGSRNANSGAGGAGRVIVYEFYN